jgi:polysaccharide export outer membrane protein
MKKVFNMARPSLPASLWPASAQLSCLLALSLFAPCSAQEASKPENKPTNPPQQAEPQTETKDKLPQTAAPVDPNTYSIGAEDVLEIKVWREPDLSGAVKVRPDGKVTLPLVGDIQAAGLTPMQLRQKAIEAFSQILNAPQVIVQVLSVESKKYYVSGEVGKSGPYSLVTPTTVLEALSIAGFKEWAKKGSIVVMRGTERLKFNYSQVVKGKNLEQNILLQDGDHIYVP